MCTKILRHIEQPSSEQIESESPKQPTGSGATDGLPSNFTGKPRSNEPRAGITPPRSTAANEKRETKSEYENAITISNKYEHANIDPGPSKNPSEGKQNPAHLHIADHILIKLELVVNW
ncbi:hypothetical protein GWI33_014732 [Rhynchophorus ferrugineus]|uniref:Uncharacterized protein n=1 Tax=Rhynchophorus ferrugineus TaxID=354439 RepID=A0A834I4L3_RHYFE|nr:hypothetical protein GWI33_014732 [Rhynchophorus ferrugineus]